MSRGNQRETDRKRAEARKKKQGASQTDGLTPTQRKERDAKALQEKMAKKQAAKAEGAK